MTYSIKYQLLLHAMQSLLERDEPIEHESKDGIIALRTASQNSNSSIMNFFIQ